MDNKEWTVFGLGCLALSSLYYFLRRYSQQSKQYKQRKKKIHDQLIQQTASKFIVDFKAIKEKQSTHVLIPKASINGMPYDNYSYFNRQIKRGLITKILTDSFLQNQTGGRFTIKYNKRQITVDLKNCNISIEALKMQNQKCIIFSENKDKRSLYQSLSYSIKTMKNLALYGVLKYSFSQDKFILEPEFLLQYLKQPKQIVEKIYDFWDQKIYKITFKKLVIAFGMVIFGYVLLYRPMKSIYQRAKIRKQGVSEGQFDYFKQKVKFVARNKGGLKCQFCMEANISYVYECGHLVACQGCYKKDKEYKCIICKKKSKKFMKIFI